MKSCQSRSAVIAPSWGCAERWIVRDRKLQSLAKNVYNNPTN